MKTKYTGVISTDFPEETSALLPCLVADYVARDYTDSYDQRNELAEHLETKFAIVYHANPKWGKKFINQNEKSRDLMTGFMAHWSEAWLRTNYPRQFSKRVKTYESRCFEFTKNP